MYVHPEETRNKLRDAVLRRQRGLSLDIDVDALLEEAAEAIDHLIYERDDDDGF